MKWTPQPAQHTGIEFARDREAAGIFARPGAGKTTLFLELTRILQEIQEAENALVVVPIRPMLYTWPAEIAKWGFDFNPIVVHGPKKEERLGAKRDRRNLYLMNPEGVLWLAGKKLPKHIDTLIVDESTRFKRYSSQRFKLLRQYLPHFRNRYIGTGTPRSRSLENLWPQICLLDNGKRLGTTITAFRRRYMVDVAPRHANYSDWQPMTGAQEEVYKLIEDIIVTLEPPKGKAPTMVDIEVPMPAAALKAYKEMERTMVALLSTGTVDASQASAAALKLRQMTGGFVYDSGREVHHLHSAKLDAAVDYIDEQNGDPLLIGVNFRHEAEGLARHIKAELNIAAPYFGGDGIKGAEAQRVIDAWNRGEVPVLIANVQSAAHGLNLQHGGCSILHYSPTYNWEDYTQFNNRLDRTGQTRQVVIAHLHTSGTVDDDVRNVLQSHTDEDAALFKYFRKKHGK